MNPDKIRNVLNIFSSWYLPWQLSLYILQKDDFKLFIYVCGAAIFIS